MHRIHHRQGFTLVELVITIAIIGILSATSIGLFRAQQMRAKRTEAMTNVEAIAKMERGYFGENGTYPAAQPAAPACPPGVKCNWDALALAAFGPLGYMAEGTVWYVYDVNSQAGGACGCTDCFTAVAYGDSDLDGFVSAIAYFHSDGVAWCPSLLVPAVASPPVHPVNGPVLDAPVDIFTFDTSFGVPPRADDY